MLKPIHHLHLLLLLGLATVAVQPLVAQNNVTVPAGGSVVINESGSYQNVTVGTGGTLQTVDSNSGGGGDHAITSPSPPAEQGRSRTTD